jgi:hypothetical protein
MVTLQFLALFGVKPELGAPVCGPKTVWFQIFSYIKVLSCNFNQPSRFYYRQWLWGLCGLWRPFMISCSSFRHTVGLLAPVISPSQGLCLHRTTQRGETKDKHQCLKRDSNSRSSVRAPEARASNSAYWFGIALCLVNLFFIVKRMILKCMPTST